MEEKISINNGKNMLCTKENDSKLKMFWRPKRWDILPDSVFDGGVGKSRWFSVTRGGRVKWVVGFFSFSFPPKKQKKTRDWRRHLLKYFKYGFTLNTYLVIYIYIYIYIHTHIYIYIDTHIHNTYIVNFSVLSSLLLLLLFFALSLPPIPEMIKDR